MNNERRGRADRVTDLADTARYVYDGLRRGYDDPYWWRGRLFDFVVGPFHTRVYPGRDGATDVAEADWDTLVVLDACRADLFEERADLDAYDAYRRVESRGSTTLEWVRQNFAGRSLGDTVYVTANPYVSKVAGDAFHDLYEPWLDDFDDDLDTVRPEAVVEAARQAHEDHPDKRVVVHFMQPHHPFVTTPELQFDGWHIAEYEEWQADADTDADDASRADADDAPPPRADAGGARRTAGPHTPWEALAKGRVTREAVWTAYGENLDYVLDSVRELLRFVDGRVVITSDHGNMLGERTFPLPLRVYGHPAGLREPELVEVPWAVVQTGHRRNVTAGSTASESESDETDVEDRLEALGYR